MERNHAHRFVTVEYLLAFIFCGAVVGETLSLSLIVSYAGTAIVGKLYLINAAVLLFVPLLFFRYIDKINRGKLLSRLLAVTVIIVLAILTFNQFADSSDSFAGKIIVLLYPVAYLSKTVLFLTFWTFLNDIYTLQESKKRFPVISAWGFGGALTGVLIARVLLTVVSTQIVMVIWIAVYTVAWFYTKKIGAMYFRLMRPAEEIPGFRKSYFGVKDLWNINLVKVLAFLYFGTFVAVFSQDFLFWKICSQWFATAEQLASFQFSFYLIHAMVTILLLRFALPNIIRKVGFTRILYGLPIVFFMGGALLFVASRYGMSWLILPLFTVIQFFRHVFFEITFAPSYQMFFAAIVKEQRGRAKTFLEGVVKPCAMLTSGLILVAGSDKSVTVLPVMTLCGLGLCVVVYVLRHIYRTTIASDSMVSFDMEEIIDGAGRHEDVSTYRLIEKYALSKDSDMRIVAVHLLKRLGTVPALKMVEKIYARDPDVRLREMIARSMDVFYGYQTKPFIEQLLNEQNPRIRANVIYAINQMHCNWKKHLKSTIAPLLFEPNRRVQLEAARYMWRYGSAHEKIMVVNFLKNLLGSRNADRKSAGLYLAGSIQVSGWEQELIDNLEMVPLQVYRKSIEVIFTKASEPIRQKTLMIIDTLSREHLTIAGEVFRNGDRQLWDTLTAFVPYARSRRLLFEMIAGLRRIARSIRASGGKTVMGSEPGNAIRRWIIKELRGVYQDAVYFQWYVDRHGRDDSIAMLEGVLRERQLRLCSWALAAMSLLDTGGLLAGSDENAASDMTSESSDLVELLESMPQEKIVMFILPILKQGTWEECAKIGRTHFSDGLKNFGRWGIYPFLKSENRLVVLSALYVCGKKYTLYKDGTRVLEALEMLTHSPNELVSSAAMDLLERKNGGGMSRGKALELLDNMLFIKKTPLFHNISADKLLRVVEITKLVSYEDGELISEAGRVADQLYIVKSGCIRIESDFNGIMAPAGLVRPGESWGESGLFSRSIRNVSAVSQGLSSIFIVKREDIRRLIKEIPDIGLNMLEVMGRRLLKRGEQVER